MRVSVVCGYELPIQLTMLSDSRGDLAIIVYVRPPAFRNTRGGRAERSSRENAQIGFRNSPPCGSIGIAIRIT